jgi:hypothetical protein
MEALQGWAAKALRLGWSALDLFGCHERVPFARINRQGLLWLLNDRRLVAPTVEGRHNWKYERRPAELSPRICRSRASPVWELEARGAHD